MKGTHPLNEKSEGNGTEKVVGIIPVSIFTDRPADMGQLKSLQIKYDLFICCKMLHKQWAQNLVATCGSLAMSCLF